MWDLYEEYINSKEFNDELKRLKNAKNKNNCYYIEKYIYFAEQLLEFFFSLNLKEI